MAGSKTWTGNIQNKLGASFTARKKGSAKKNPKNLTPPKKPPNPKLRGLLKRWRSQLEEFPVAKAGTI